MAEEETEGRNSPPERDSTTAPLDGLAIPKQNCPSTFTRYHKYDKYVRIFRSEMESTQTQMESRSYQSEATQPIY